MKTGVRATCNSSQYDHWACLLRHEADIVLGQAACQLCLKLGHCRKLYLSEGQLNGYLMLYIGLRFVTVCGEVYLNILSWMKWSGPHMKWQACRERGRGGGPNPQSNSEEPKTAGLRVGKSLKIYDALTSLQAVLQKIAYITRCIALTSLPQQQAHCPLMGGRVKLLGVLY